jgi:hypothetical protein
MLKSDPSMGSRGFKLTLEARKAFKELHKAFISPLVVRYFNLNKKIKIITDILKVSQGAILLQLDSNSTLTRSQVY